MRRPRRQLRRPHRTEPFADPQPQRRHGHPARRRHDPGHHEPGQPVHVPHRDERRLPRLLAALRRHVPPTGTRRPGRHRRRRHARDRPRIQQARHPARRRAQDDRQRHRRHHQLLRLRHRRQLRHRRDRPPAHHGGSASSHHGRRGDGPLRRLDRPLRRHRRRRRCDSDSGDSVQHRRRSRSGCRPAKSGAPASASSSRPKAPRRKTASAR